MKPSLDVVAGEISSECEGLLAPLSVVTVKGYTRAMAMWCVLLCARENAHFLEAEHVRQNLSCHALFSQGASC